MNYAIAIFIVSNRRLRSRDYIESVSEDGIYCGGALKRADNGNMLAERKKDIAVLRPVHNGGGILVEA